MKQLLFCLLCIHLSLRKNVCPIFRRTEINTRILSLQERLAKWVEGVAR
jgi:hypothetical protein